MVLPLVFLLAQGVMFVVGAVVLMVVGPGLPTASYANRHGVSIERDRARRAWHEAEAKYHADRPKYKFLLPRCMVAYVAALVLAALFLDRETLVIICLAIQLSALGTFSWIQIRKRQDISQAVDAAWPDRG